MLILLLLFLVSLASIAAVVAGATMVWLARPGTAVRGQCARCGYATEGLVRQALCPECGHAPNRPAPILGSPLLQRRRTLVGFFVMLLGLTGPVCLLTLPRRTFAPPPPAPPPVPGPIAPVVMPPALLNAAEALARLETPAPSGIVPVDRSGRPLVDLDAELHSLAIAWSSGGLPGPWIARGVPTSASAPGLPTAPPDERGSPMRRLLEAPPGAPLDWQPAARGDGPVGPEAVAPGSAPPAAFRPLFPD